MLYKSVRCAAFVVYVSRLTVSGFEALVAELARSTTALEMVVHVAMFSRDGVPE